MQSHNQAGEVDTSSKFAVACFIRQLGFSHVTIVENPKSIIDITADTPDGNPVAIEVKARNCSHVAYPDMRCEHLKYRVVQAGVYAGTYRGGILACIYSDGYIAMGDLLDGRRSQGLGPKSTTWEPVTVAKDYWDVDRAREWYVQPLLDAVKERFGENGK